MDIVTRLKDFIQYLGIQVTQFADNCSIPRPSMSQLLNGRNKKVSNELIGKIHVAYPQLSVLWLMFGQGNMLVEDSTLSSEPQNCPTIDFSNAHSAENMNGTANIDFEIPADEISSENFPNRSASKNSQVLPDQPSIPTEKLSNASQTAESDHISPKTDNKMAAVTLPTNSSKKIVNIIVYYSDNSFESFIPNPC